MPEMCNSIVDVYGGKHWNPVEVKADMIGHYLAEFSMTYKPVRHGKVVSVLPDPLSSLPSDESHILI